MSFVRFSLCDILWQVCKKATIVTQYTRDYGFRASTCHVGEKEKLIVVHLDTNETALKVTIMVSLQQLSFDGDVVA